MTVTEIDETIKELREEWIKRPDKRPIIERQAALMKRLRAKLEKKNI